MSIKVERQMFRTRCLVDNVATMWNYLEMWSKYADMKGYEQHAEFLAERAAYHAESAAHWAFTLFPELREYPALSGEAEGKEN